MGAQLLLLSGAWLVTLSSPWLGGVLGAVVFCAGAVIELRLVRKRSRRLEMINERLGGEIDDRVGQSLAARHALILGLAKLADCRDTDTGAHLERICLYSVILAEQLKAEVAEIDDFWIENLRVAASLHDIGKVGIPDAVLLKAGALEDNERLQIERHPIIGADTLIAIRSRLGDDDLIEMSLQICLSHHEHWDGTGYPYGLQGEDIPMAGRLVALADVYDALTSRRAYKAAMDHAGAMRIICDQREKQFDPRVVDAFLDVEKKFDAMRRKLHTDDEDEAWTILRAA